MDIYVSEALNYSSMDDDNDNVTSSTTTVSVPTLKCRTKKTKINRCANDDDDDDDNTGDVVSSNSNRKRIKKKTNSDFEVAIDNFLLYEAMMIKHDDVMIQFACKHCCNRKNIPLMEWSEAVLIQLCDLKMKDNFKHNSWLIIKDIVDNNQWSLPVSYNVRKFASALKSLSQILEQNHKFKIVEHNLNPMAMFVSVPTIRFDILEKYKIDSQKIAPPIKCPRLKLKIK